ncbi:MAG: phosphoglycerate mutase family protein [Flavobacterium sp.]|nr:phosphoglycerate mutase family protein [Flavobacterium sp.]
MKLFVTILFSLFFVALKAQTTTIILLRHAEKDTSLPNATTMKADPPLTKAGEARALLLLAVLNNFKPDIIYSTNYMRTKATVTPLAQKFTKHIVMYNPADLSKFAEELRLQKGKTIIVAGHSNTTPALVNALLKEKKYESLPDSVYNKFWIVTLDGDKITDKVIEY